MSELRVPPHSEEAEMGVLGSIMLDPQGCLPKCLDKGINPSDFYDRRNQTLFENLSDMHSSSSRYMDAITIGEWLKDSNALDAVGGYDYLVELQGTVLVPAHVGFYCDIITEKKLARDLIEKSRETIDRAYKGDDSPLSILNEARSSLFSLDKSSASSSMSNEEACDKVIDRWNRIIDGERYGLEWHVKEIQDVFGSFLNNGNPYFLAAEPGGGKSVCLQGLLTKWSIFQGKPCACASLEMTHEKIMERMLSERGDLSSWALNNGHFEESVARSMVGVAERVKDQIASAPLHINDRHINTDELCSWGLSMYEQHGIEALGVDYFQLLNPPEHKKLEGIEAVKYNCGKLLEFSKNTGVITIALSQLVKLPVDKSGNPRKPRQDDLFGGRVIDAHSEGTVIFYNREGSDLASIAKNRNGGTGDVEFWFNRKKLRFQNLAN